MYTVERRDYSLGCTSSTIKRFPKINLGGRGKLYRLRMINEGMKNLRHVPVPDESSSSLPDKDNENDAGIANTLPKAAKSCRLTNF